MKSRDPQSDNRQSYSQINNIQWKNMPLGNSGQLKRRKVIQKIFLYYRPKKKIIMKGIKKNYSLGKMIYLPNFRSSPEIFIQTNDVMGFPDENQVRQRGKKKRRKVVRTITRGSRQLSGRHKLSKILSMDANLVFIELLRDGKWSLGRKTESSLSYLLYGI